jgi:uncharacterized membrane protein
METFKTVTLWVALGAEAIAVAIIALAMVEAVFRLLRASIGRSGRGTPEHPPYREKEEVRLGFGRWLVLAREFLLAADIMRTAVAPSWTEIGQLAAIAVLRTALNFFLQKEMERAEAHGRSAGLQKEMERAEAHERSAGLQKEMDRPGAHERSAGA